MEIAELKAEVLAKRNEIKQCPVCGSTIKDRHVALFRKIIKALYRIYCWCGEHKCHEFSRKQIDHLIGKTEYARMGDLIRFGGIVYKPVKKRNGEFGLNMARAKAFFRGEYKIPVQITLNQITNEIIEATYAEVKDFPELYALLNAEGIYDHERLIRVPIDEARQQKAGLPPVGQSQNKLL